MYKENKGCVILSLLIGIPMVIGMYFCFFDNTIDWHDRDFPDIKNPIFVSKVNKIAHSHNKCRQLHGDFVQIEYRNIRESSFTIPCSKCFRDNDAKILLNVARNQTKIENHRNLVIMEIQKMFHDYNDYDLRRDLSTKSGQEFIFQYAKQYLSNLRLENYHKTKEDQALFNMGVLEKDEYGIFDISLYVRLVYHKCRRFIGEEKTLREFQNNLIKDDSFCYHVYSMMNNIGYNVGDFQSFKMAVQTVYDDYEAHSDIEEFVIY